MKRQVTVSESTPISGPAVRPRRLADLLRSVVGNILYDTAITALTHKRQCLENTYHPSNLSSTNSGHLPTEPVRPDQQHRHPHRAQSGRQRHLEQLVASQERRHRGLRGTH
jgi:hypothetical protein